MTKEISVIVPFYNEEQFIEQSISRLIDINLFKKVVDEADNLGVGAITLASRGEPTLHKNFVDMLEGQGEN